MSPRTPHGSTRFVHLSKSGRGLSIGIPRELLEALGWHYPETLEIWITDRTLHVTKAVSARDVPPAAGPTPPAWGGK